MTTQELCTEEEIVALVHGFYDRVRADALLAPIFDAHVGDWDTHLAKMVRFWSSILLGAGTYRGSPMPTHMALPGLRADLFQQWLGLFHLTAQELPNRRLAERAEQYAHRIARSLWYGYQMTHEPDQQPTEAACD